MTDAETPHPEPARQHLDIWAESFSQVLGQVGGSPLACVVLSEAPAELGPAAEADLWVLCTCAGGLRGEMSLRLPPAATLRLAQMLMSEPPAPEMPLTAEHREAALELLRQVAGMVASALKALWGEVQLRLDAAAGAPSWPASSTFWLRAGEPDSVVAEAEVLVSAALAAALRTEKAQESPAPAPASPAAPGLDENTAN